MRTRLTSDRARSFAQSSRYFGVFVVFLQKQHIYIRATYTTAYQEILLPQCRERYKKLVDIPKAIRVKQLRMKLMPLLGSMRQLSEDVYHKA